jgi:hypothetical protein
LGTAFTRCAMATVLDNGSVIEMSHNYWGGNQNICDLTGSTVVQFTPATGPNQVGPFL